MRLIKKKYHGEMNTEKLKKNIMFIFTFYFPVGILVYYFENFYLVCIDPQHQPIQHYVHSFPMGDLGISFGFFFNKCFKANYR